ncbi:MAG TPA: hypothetical protein VF450_17810 [Noviherbaspirillum sp.]
MEETNVQAVSNGKSPSPVLGNSTPAPPGNWHPRFAKPFPAIDQQTMRFIVGVIALSLPYLTNHFAMVGGPRLCSISESYWRGDWPQTIFVGFLFAIASFLVAYNGSTWLEMVLSKAAAIAALGVAMFPCACTEKPEIIPHLHYVCAGAMFAVLSYFCWAFLIRAREKGHKQAIMRATIYALCGVTIVGCSLALAYNGLTQDSMTVEYPHFVYWGEAGGLWAFGISWLTASHVLPLVNARRERHYLFRS